MGIDEKGIYSEGGRYWITWEFQIAFWCGAISGALLW
jgi:hypothetical protein